MLACVTATRPFYLILELCDDNLLNYLRAKAKLLRQQRATEKAQLQLSNIVNCVDVAGREVPYYIQGGRKCMNSLAGETRRCFAWPLSENSGRLQVGRERSSLIKSLLIDCPIEPTLSSFTSFNTPR